MGQGQDEGGKTMEKENRSRSHLDLATSEKSSMDEKHEVSTGIERSHHNGHVITRRARSNTQDLEAMDGAGVEGKKSGRGRSGTLFGGSGKDASADGKNAGGEGSAAPSASATAGQTGNEAHDHDEAFPEEERQQMKALLEEVTGQLGEPLSSSLISTCERSTESLLRAPTVVFPTRFLEAESAGGNFLFSKDRIPYVTNSPVCPQVLCADLSVFSRRRIGERQPFGRESGSRQTCPNTFADCSPCRSTTKPAPAPAPPQARSSDTTHTKTP